MKKAKVLAVITTLFLSVSAFAQLGYFSAPAPGQNYIWKGGVFYVCATTTTAADCIASADVTIYSDAAGASPISQTSGVAIPVSGQVTFYAQPGLYKFVYTYTNGPTPAPALFNVVPNVSGNIALADGYFFVPASTCTFTASGTGAGANGTFAIEGSVPAKIAQTTDGGTNTLVCAITLPTRITSGQGAVIQNLDVHYGITLHNATSIGTATLTSYTAPAPGATETPSSATLVAGFGGSLTQSSATGNLATVTAGQFYTNRITLGTPAQVADRQVIVLTWTIADSNSETFLTYVSGIGVHYKIANL